jgi:large subunit ribosomal protein L11
MAKKIVGYIKIQIPAGKANPAPPVGTALGPRGLNIIEFCKAFNAATQNHKPGVPTPVLITAYADRSFTFILKTPPASYLIREAAKLEKGSSEAGKKTVGQVTAAQVTEIAKVKMQDMNAYDVNAAYQMIKGTAVSMGIEVIE